MFQVPLVTSGTALTTESFWSSVLLYHDRPNLINRKLAAVDQILLCQLSLPSSSIRRPSDIFRREALLYEIRKLKDFSDISLDFVQSITEGHSKNIKVTEANWNNLKSSPVGVFVSIRVLWPRVKCDSCIEVVVFDKRNNYVTFFAVQERVAFILAPSFPYHLELTSEGILRIILDSFEDADTSSGDWIADKLFLKLIKWAESGDDSSRDRSLSLLPAGEYCKLYNELKTKYGNDLVKVWPEKANTDPKKFVFEDLAIATYLLCLWRKLEAKDVNFVDLGCGNGLLVYILNLEGYNGYGVDLRRRKIWDMFSSKSTLKVETVTPSTLYHDATWIIGNHSDELTPWIPVMALRSSPKTNFFVLPCCPYDFNGQKYIRTNSKVSQYCDYLKYVQDISSKCGFKTDTDKLRIPSTKRTCLVGIRNHCEAEFDKINAEVEDLLKLRLKSNFVPRDSVEKVRNCTQLDKGLIKRILNLVICNLLAVENFGKKNSEGLPWNKGGTICFNDLVKKIPSEDLKLLKDNCGGLQTLLRNHRFLFVVEKGVVSLREPLLLSKDTKRYRDKPCWFQENHPNGCLYSGEICASRHAIN